MIGVAIFFLHAEKEETILKEKKIKVLKLLRESKRMKVHTHAQKK